MAPTWLLFFYCASVAQCSLRGAATLLSPRTSGSIKVPGSTPPGAGVPLEAFVSYSIEFAFFPDFAGNLSHPNTFSNNLLDNIGHLSGSKPYMRIGGNTQDYAIFDSNLTDAATVGVYDASITQDYPTQLTFGPRFFESYQTWPDTKFTHGFNLGRNSSSARRALIESVPYACRALGDGRLLYWELGNEPDLFKTSAQGPVRPPTWNETSYADEWRQWSRAIEKALRGACPGLASKELYKYYAPSFAGTSNSLDPVRAWEAGLDEDGDIAVVTTHNYISGATSPGVTLQHTLMNHTANIVSIRPQLNESRLLRALPRTLEPDLPYIMGEANSLYNQGRPGLSNTFGAALWGVDFSLWCAANNIQRVHMHQGTNYRYQAWQPVETNDTAKGTKAPYYGNIAVAAFLGNVAQDSKPEVANLPLPDEREAAYAGYVHGKLDRMIVINMMEFNATEGNEYINRYPRPIEEYSFDLPKSMNGWFDVQWLMANGSDAITGVTFDGHSFKYELDNGRPARMHNVTSGQKVRVMGDGILKLQIPRSSAAIVRFAS